MGSRRGTAGGARGPMAAAGSRRLECLALSCLLLLAGVLVAHAAPDAAAPAETPAAAAPASTAAPASAAAAATSAASTVASPASAAQTSTAPASAATSTSAASSPTAEAPRAFVRIEPKPLPVLGTDGGAGQTVLIVPIHGTIEPGLVPYIRRALAENPNPTIVIFDVDTFGGRVDAATEIRDTLLSIKVPTVAFIHRRAISAGALISLATDHLVFSEGASMGAATPIQQSPGGEAQAVGEKMVSYMRAEMRATAEAKGRSGDLAEAMVDADVAIDGVIPHGKLLTVTTELAEKLGLSSARHDDREALLKALGLEKATVIEPVANWAEQVARFLTNPAVSGILMLVGMLGLYLELSTPGVGLPGFVGVLALAAFFGGHMIVALAGWEEILLFVLGLGFLAVEVFIIPGFGVTGVVGLALLGTSLVMAMVDLPWGVAMESGIMTTALTTVLIAILGSVALFFIVLRYLPDTRFASGLMLRTSLAGAEAPIEQESGGRGPLQHLLGRTGVAETDLRPAGKVRIGTAIHDVVGQMAWIDRGTPVRVVDVDGVRVMVARVEDDAKNEAAAGAPPEAAASLTREG